MSAAPDPLQALLDAGAIDTSLFPASSRYRGIPFATLERPGDEPIVYLRRRFVPPPERFAVVGTHTVVQGDRLDILAARYLGDAELYWRLCDANAAVRPDDLVADIGRRLALALPDGIPGAGDA